MLVRLTSEHFGLAAGAVCEVRVLFGVYSISKVVFGEDPRASPHHYLFVIDKESFEVLDDDSIQGG